MYDKYGQGFLGLTASTQLPTCRRPPLREVGVRPVGLRATRGNAGGKARRPYVNTFLTYGHVPHSR
jgi:hypothetical protein